MPPTLEGLEQRSLASYLLAVGLPQIQQAVPIMTGLYRDVQHTVNVAQATLNQLEASAEDSPHYHADAVTALTPLVQRMVNAYYPLRFMGDQLAATIYTTAAREWLAGDPLDEALLYLGPLVGLDVLKPLTDLENQADAAFYAFNREPYEEGFGYLLWDNISTPAPYNS